MPANLWFKGHENRVEWGYYLGSLAFDKKKNSVHIPIQ